MAKRYIVKKIFTEGILKGITIEDEQSWKPTKRIYTQYGGSKYKVLSVTEKE